MHLLFEASLTQPICLVKNRSSSGVQVPATCEKAWRAVPSKSDTKQSNGKPNDKPKQKRVAVCFSYFCASRFVFRTFFAVPIYALFSYFASPLFFGFPAACVLLIFAPSTHTHLLVDLLSQSFCFSFCNHDCRTHGCNGCVECLPLAFCHRPCSVQHQQLAHACGNMFGVH